MEGYDKHRSSTTQKCISKPFQRYCISVVENRLSEYFLLQKHTGCNVATDINAWKVTVLQRAICLPSLHRNNLKFVQSIRLVTNDAPKPIASPFQNVHFLLPFTLSKRNHEFSHYGSLIYVVHSDFLPLPESSSMPRLCCPKGWGPLVAQKEEVCRDPSLQRDPVNCLPGNISCCSESRVQESRFLTSFPLQRVPSSQPQAQPVV